MTVSWHDNGVSRQGSLHLGQRHVGLLRVAIEQPGKRGLLGDQRISGPQHFGARHRDEEVPARLGKAVIARLDRNAAEVGAEGLAVLYLDVRRNRTDLIETLIRSEV